MPEATFREELRKMIYRHEVELAKLQSRPGTIDAEELEELLADMFGDIYDALKTGRFPYPIFETAQKYA